MTLSALQEERRTLESEIKHGSTHKNIDDMKFDLEVLNKNIQHVQDKIRNATQ